MIRLACSIALSLLAGSTCAANLRCVSLDYPPLISLDASGHARGLAVDIVEAVFASIGHTVTVEVFPWSRAMALVQLGQRDCVFTIFHTAERARTLDFSKESIIPQVIYFYARNDGSASFDGNVQALAGRPVGTVLGINYGPKFEAVRASLDVKEVSSLEQNLRKLALGRIDFTPSNLYTASYTLGRMSSTDLPVTIIKLPQALDNVASHIAFAKARQLTALRDQFDTALRAYIASGAYRRLLDQYKIEITPELARFLDNK